MIIKSLSLPLFVCVAGLAFPALAHAAETPGQKNDQAQEYIQVRKIALKDARVQDAYKRADEKLNERILEIDPSLKSYMDKHGDHQPPAAAPAKPAATPVKHTAPVKTTAGDVHIVAKGETLSSIAAHYNVTVAGLKSANNITDERKLRVGQKLSIPSAKSTSSTKSASKTIINKPASEPKKEEGFWDKLKSDF